MKWVLWSAGALVVVYVGYVTVPSAVRYWKLKNM